MKEFIARFGYTLAWAFGTPQQTLDEAFEGWFKFGLSFLIFTFVIALAGLIIIIIYIKGNKKR